MGVVCVLPERFWSFWSAVPTRPLPVHLAPFTALHVSLQQTFEHQSVPPRDAPAGELCAGPRPPSWGQRPSRLAGHAAPITCCSRVSWLKSWWVLYSVRK